MAPVVGMAAGIAEGVVDVVVWVESMTLGSQAEERKVPSTIGDVQEERQGFVVAWERIAEVVAGRIVVVDEEC